MVLEEQEKFLVIRPLDAGLLACLLPREKVIE
jgi:hypothetical protein